MRNKKKALRKDFYMEIYKTLHRFMSIFLIVALGVAFFSGVRSTEPDMRLSADAFYDESNMMDIRILSELGLTDADVEAVRQTEGVKEVMPGYSYDALWQQDTELRAVKLMSLPDKMNQITVTDGRLPSGSGECLMDERLAELSGTSLGDTIRLESGDDTDLTDIVGQEEYVVTGFGSTALYLSLERGTTSIGNGSLDGFLVLWPEDFTLEAYTEIALTVEGALEETCYTDAYDDCVQAVEDRLEEISDERCQIRYDEVQQEAQEKIDEGKADIEDAKQQLADAQQKIDDGETKISDAKDEIAGHEKDIADAKKKLADADQEIADGKVELADGWDEYQKGVEQCVDGMDRLKESEAQLAEGRRQTEAGYQQLDAADAQVQEALAGLDARQQQIEGQDLPEDIKNQALQEIAAARVQLEENARELAGKRAELDATSAYLDAQQAEWEKGYWEIQEALEELKEAKALLEEKEQELKDGEKKVSDARKEVTDGEQKLADAKVTLAEGEEDLEEGKKEYEEKRVDAEADIADGEEKIRQAEEDLKEMEVPEWYVLDRNTIQTYVEYGQNAERIGAIGEVFPVIFFLVAALVSLTTMTRMVEEQRTQIGTLKALGYRKMEIAGKYLFYALLATLSGSILGCVVGQKLLPYVIITAYKIMYNNLPDVLTPMNTGYSLMATALAVICTVGAALMACQKALRSVPAELMRPAAPKAGKRILLERFRFLWKRMNFTQKSTARNLVRYKKRFFMTIFGIGGCMALLLVGFGIKDSLICIADTEFGEIRRFSGMITMEKDTGEEEAESLMEKIGSDDRIRDALRVEEMSVDAGSGRVSSEKYAYVIVPSDAGRLSDFICLRERKGHEPLSLGSDGVIITEKLAKLLDAKIGDSIYIKDSDTDKKEVTVSGITENYYMHYIYMSAELYESLYGEAPEFQEILLDAVRSDEEFEDGLQEDYMKESQVAAVSFQSGTSERIRDMLRSMDVLIYVLVISAGLLAFVVLYNLNNINITERRRELATLRVLGFYNKEVSQYVFRENVVLTVIGAFLGIGLGCVLHQFVIVTAEIDSMMFGRVISLKSYIYSILLTLLFSGIINGSMHFKLKKIDMVESLKSVE